MLQFTTEKIKGLHELGYISDSVMDEVNKVRKQLEQEAPSKETEQETEKDLITELTSDDIEREL